VNKRTRILFVAEAVTLAHVVRPHTLAQSLDASLYEVHFAQAPLYRHLLDDACFQQHDITSISPATFMARLDRGEALYDLTTLQAYVEEDRRLIAAVQPDIVVGDFRLSLATSAELEGVPYVTVSNACWSPFALQRFPVPELPISRLLGPTLGQWLFSLARPLAFALHCLPMHRLRRSHGLHSLGFDLRKVYTHADVTLYADLPSLYNMQPLPAHHHFIGPVNWSPAVPLPGWWQDIPAEKPVVYVTLGSSGQVALLPEVLAALEQLPVTALVSTAGAEMPQPVPDNVFWDSYLPGKEAVKVASLVVCNGGSPTTHQALAGGVPVIGIAGNLDQYLNMATLQRAAAGVLLRAGTCRADRLAAVMKRVLAEPAYRETAQDLAESLGNLGQKHEFNRIINEMRIES